MDNSILPFEQSYYPLQKLKSQGKLVSSNKPYVRPIVGGKEVKRVEFCLKMH